MYWSRMLSHCSVRPLCLIFRWSIQSQECLSIALIQIHSKKDLRRILSMSPKHWLRTPGTSLTISNDVIIISLKMLNQLMMISLIIHNTSLPKTTTHLNPPSSSLILTIPSLMNLIKTIQILLKEANCYKHWSRQLRIIKLFIFPKGSPRSNH